MINAEGDAVFGHVQGRGQGAGFDHVAVEALVHPPPDVFQNLEKIGRDPRWSRHAAGKSGIDVMMATGKRPGHEAAPAVHPPVLGRQFTVGGSGITEGQAARGARLNHQMGFAELQSLGVEIVGVLQI